MTTPYRKEALARDRVQARANALGIQLSDQEQWDFLERVDSLDLQAAPGSGKTSLISLKLLMLATEWTSTTRGICVLSHTNTAKDEIIARTGDTPAGARLQRYPHFIGTIQSFTNTFLARPYLRGRHKQLQIIDDDAYANQATRALARDPRFGTLKASLSRRTNGDDLVARATFTFESGQLTVRSSGNLPFGPQTTSGRQFTELKHHLADQGIFRYADMFALAELHLARCPSLGSAIAHRFPFVLVDEMQDTNDRQQNLLAQVFDHASTTVQRVGDVNQRIFTEGVAHSTSFPRPGFIELPVSRRFGSEIAELASSLTVQRAQNIRGAGPAGTIAVLLYDENSVTKVVPTFERIAIEVVSPTLLQARPPQVLASRKRPGKAKVFPQSLACYVPAFAEADGEDEQALLLLTTRAAREQWRSGANRAAVDLLWEAVKVVFAAATEEALPTLRSLDRAPSSPGARMRALLLEILTASIDGETRWICLMERLTNVLCEFSDNTGRVRDTVNESSRYAPPPPAPSAAGCEQTGTASATVRSQFNSIQRAKGETHSATLILECLDRTGKKHDVHEVLSSLAVDGDLGGASSTVRRIAQLVFVGATRPAQLLAFAVHRDRASSYVDLLKSNGWAVHDLTLDVP